MPSIDGDGRRRRRPDGAGASPSTIGRMISTGSLEVGSACPRSASCRAASACRRRRSREAWRRLADVGAIETRGRNGTFVRHPTGPGGPRRYRQITEGPGHFALDLSSGTPDPDLLPDLAPIVAKVSRQSLTSSYLDNPVLPALEDELRATWPFPPEAITVVDGAMDALDRVASVVLHLGDRVVVEHPGFPPMLDLLERLSCDVVGVDVDDEGLDVGAAPRRARQRPGGGRGPPTACPEPGRRGDVAAPGQGDRRGAAPERDARRRGRPRQRDLLCAARQRRHVAARAHGAHPQLLEEPRARPSPRRRRRRRRRRDGRREPPPARARLVQPDPAVRAARADPRPVDCRHAGRGPRRVRRTAESGLACSSITASTSPAPMASTCGWASTTSAQQSSRSPPGHRRRTWDSVPGAPRHRPRPCHRRHAVARARTRQVAEQLADARSPGDPRRRRSTAPPTADPERHNHGCFGYRLSGTPLAGADPGPQGIRRRGRRGTSAARLRGRRPCSRTSGRTARTRVQPAGDGPDIRDGQSPTHPGDEPHRYVDRRGGDGGEARCPSTRRRARSSRRPPRAHEIGAGAGHQHRPGNDGSTSTPARSIARTSRRRGHRRGRRALTRCRIDAAPSGDRRIADRHHRGAVGQALGESGRRGVALELLGQLPRRPSASGFASRWAHSHHSGPHVGLRSTRLRHSATSSLGAGPSSPRRRRSRQRQRRVDVAAPGHVSKPLHRMHGTSAQ